MNKITVDFEKVTGKVKPFHAVNNGPIGNLESPLFRYFKDASIPYSRLHDTGGVYGGGRFVDIENIFRDFSADPSDPESYDFAFTDWLLAKLHENGIEPFFRLGTTIENYHMIKAYRIFPPADNLKWAKICEGIIKHYNYGWADGFHYNIKYWEIWNEPDGEPEIEDNANWKGTMEQYFELYRVTSNYLKSAFPEIKIGGYASCGFYELYGGFVWEANSSHRTEYFIEFFQKFLDYITDPAHLCPFDFFSWHSYDDVHKNYKSTKYVREELDKRGLYNTESILNEWNCGTALRGTMEDAAKIAEMMCSLHSSSLDMLVYYDGQVDSSYGGIFNPLTYDIFPAYFAFAAFGELYRLGNCATLEKPIEDFPAVAAVDGKYGKIMISNPLDCKTELGVELLGDWKIVKRRDLVGLEGLKETAIDAKIPPCTVVVFDCEK